MNPKDKSMICRMAGNIAGPLLAAEELTNNPASQQETNDKINIVATHALECAMRINKLAAEKMPAEKIR